MRVTLPHSPRDSKLRRLLGAEHGFTMIVALGVMLVTSLLLVATFTAADSEIHLSRENTTASQAYYAALAGIQEFEYQLQNNPDYWQSCQAPAAYEGEQRYEVRILTASEYKEGSECNPSNPFKSVIESKGPLANTFRIESVGCAGRPKMTTCEAQKRPTVATRRLVATFQVTGFLDYVYFTKYELIDPSLYSHKAKCEEYYESGKRSSECETLIFAEGDSVNGPMHTDDAANVTCSSKLSFGRKGHEPPDAVEIDGGTWPSCGGSEPTYYTATKSYSKGVELSPPESDSSLQAYVERGPPQDNELYGRNELVLNGTNNTITDKYWVKVKGVATEETRELEWPANGLIYVAPNTEFGCNYTYKNDSSDAADNSTENEQERGCGTVYVHGTYSKSLTVAAESELVINGNLIPKGVSAGEAPTGTDTLGLIASKFVRVYHPCTGSGNGSGYLENPWIYAAILSTDHSFIVDNYECGSPMGKLGVYGAIAQKFRGAVGTVGYGGQTSGYIKEYKYDERLATDEPPYFLAPLKAGWKIIRETSPESDL